MRKLETIEEFAKALGEYNLQWVADETGLRCHNLVASRVDKITHCPITAFCYLESGGFPRGATSYVREEAKRFVSPGSELADGLWSIMVAAANFSQPEKLLDSPRALECYVMLRKHLSITERSRDGS